MHEPPIIDVVCGLVWRAGRILATKRLASAHLADSWEFPGGKRKANEDDETALKRELKEEVGLDVQVHELFYETHYVYPERSVHLRFYRCDAEPDAEAQLLEVADARWLAPSQLHGYTFPPANEALLAKLTAAS